MELAAPFSTIWYFDAMIEMFLHKSVVEYGKRLVLTKVLKRLTAVDEIIAKWAGCQVG